MANEFIYRAATVDMDETKREQMIGEAYFLRGFWYFRLRTDYRDAVIRTLPQDADPETHGLSSGDEVLEQAISDFKEAKSRLPKLRSSDENGRVTQGAAIAPSVTRITFGIIIDFPNRFSIKFRIVTEVVLILLSQIVTITIHYNFKLMDCLAVMKCWNRLFQTLRKPSLVCLSFVQAMRTVV